MGQDNSGSKGIKRGGMRSERVVEVLEILKMDGNYKLKD